MKKSNLLPCVLLILSFQSFGAEKTKKPTTEQPSAKVHSKDAHKNHDGHEHKDGEQEAGIAEMKKDSVLIKVKGMVCAFCAQGIKKNFNAMEEVKETKVDLDKMEVNLLLKKGMSLNQKQIEKVITNAGFKFVEMK